MEKEAGDGSDSEESKVQLSDMRFVDVSKFKGKTLINIREYYKDKDDMMKPGKRGISLSVDQWNILVENAEKISDWVVAMGNSRK